MEFHAVFDASGFPLAFYPSDVWPEPPEGGVLISEADWQEFITYQGLRKWVDGAVVPYDPPVVPDPLPTVVTASQAKIALLNAGVLDAVEAMVMAHPYRPVRIWYADANQWERGHAYVQALGAELGLSDTDIDNLFVAASFL